MFYVADKKLDQANNIFGIIALISFLLAYVFQNQEMISIAQKFYASFLLFISFSVWINLYFAHKTGAYYRIPLYHVQITRNYYPKAFRFLFFVYIVFSVSAFSTGLYLLFKTFKI